jgi:hypothetical protein
MPPVMVGGVNIRVATIQCAVIRTPPLNMESFVATIPDRWRSFQKEVAELRLILYPFVLG